MRIVPVLSWAALIVGAIGMVAGWAFHVPKGVHLGVFLIGAGFALGGLESVVTRRMSFRFFGDTSEGYAGAPALIWGLMALLMGTVVIATAYLMRSGAWRPTMNQLTHHPGPAFLVIGLLLAGAGMLLMLRPYAGGSMWRNVLVRYPRIFIGLAIVLTGLFAAGIGAWGSVDARGFDRHVRSPEGRYVRVVCETWKELMRANTRVHPR